MFLYGPWINYKLVHNSELTVSCCLMLLVEETTIATPHLHLKDILWIIVKFISVPAAFLLLRERFSRHDSPLELHLWNWSTLIVLVIFSVLFWTSGSWVVLRLTSTCVFFTCFEMILACDNSTRLKLSSCN